MSSTTNDAAELNRYCFWAWQYTARNVDFIENRRLLIDTVRMLEDRKIMSQHVALDTVSDKSAWQDGSTILCKSPVQNGLSARCPTDEEQCQAAAALSLQGYFSKFGYAYGDISLETTPASDIIRNIATYISDAKYPRKMAYTSSYPFQTGRLILNKDAKPTGLFHTRVGSDTAGKRTLLIDFAQPLDIILYEFRAIYEHVNGGQGREMDIALTEIVRRQNGLTRFNDTSRAVGLWLWEFVQSNGGEKMRGVVAAGIRAMKAQLGPEIKALGFADSEERVFRSFYRRTAACIEACEVLTFK